MHKYICSREINHIMACHISFGRMYICYLCRLGKFFSLISSENNEPEDHMVQKQAYELRYTILKKIITITYVIKYFKFYYYCCLSFIFLIRTWKMIRFRTEP